MNSHFFYHYVEDHYIIFGTDDIGQSLLESLIIKIPLEKMNGIIVNKIIEQLNIIIEMNNLKEKDEYI